VTPLVRAGDAAPTCLATMTSAERDQGGALVVRAWFEAGDDGFRARITSVVDIESGRREIVVKTSADAVLDVVREWLARVLAQGPGSV